MKWCIIPAAGVGARFGANMPKQYVEIARFPVLYHTLQRLATSRCFDALALIVSPTDDYIDHCILPSECTIQRLSVEHSKIPLLILKIGGTTRAQTVFNAVEFLFENQLVDNNDFIAVHDAARCAIDHASLKRLMEANHPDGALLAIRTPDTLKFSPHHQVERTINREGIYQAQTPQVFTAKLLREALKQADLEQISDESSAVEQLGKKPLLVEGSLFNRKLTTREDAIFLEHILTTQPQLRVGQGYDVHRLTENRPLIIGGVEIPYEKGLLGHSDADVLLHALIDALLGASSLGDIGRLFPDTDEQFHHANSRVLLRTAFAKVRALDWQIVNIDATIIAQQPKLAPHIPKMIETIGSDLSMNPQMINIKAKTNEQLGYLGRSEAIEAQVAVLLQR